MCLAVPGKIVRLAGSDAEIDMQGNRVQASTILVPDVKENDWVLIHAGFAIQTLEEGEAMETFALLKEMGAMEEKAE